MTDHTAHMRTALDQARVAEAAGDHPYGSVIAGPRGAIVARNQVESTQDVTAHAELAAVRAATAAWGLDLSGSTLITSFEPCAMCAGAILNAGIRHLVIAVQSVPGIEPSGRYSVENLLELLGCEGDVVVERGLLGDEAAAYYSGIAAAS
ncbi:MULTISPECIES: nucleoside deaminase [unclassified Microbacterium]|uniref:nucleoside deaminase n=1 Tax=unclassified Microbacterium TaxID=2609290 RepID=UPI001E4293B7|nr:nucleoside deaminase [Microbacterium sp. Au-Mic1]MCE4027633.1 nucleoside deaminase [Microbacterium sp. Au-Mic1]